MIRSSFFMQTILGATTSMLLLAAGVLAQGSEPSWTVYLNANEIRALAFDGTRIWAASGGGVLAFNPTSGERRVYHRQRDGLLSDSANAVVLGGDGRVWIGTEKAGISILTPEQESWEPYTSLLRPIPNDQIQRIRLGGDSLLVGTAKGFSVIVQDELRLPCVEGVDLCGLPSFDVRDLASDPGGDGIWIATASGAVHARRDNAGVWQYVTFAAGPSNPSIERMIRFRGEWVAAFPDGVRVLRGSGGGSEWVPLGTGIPPNAEIADLLDDGARLLAASKLGVWAMAAEGVWSLIGGRAIPASSLLTTPDGSIWAGGRDPAERLDGLWRFDGNEWTRITVPGPSVRNHYRALAFDSHGVLHASTAHRFTVPMRQSFDGMTWSTPTDLTDWTFDILFTPSDGLWMAQCCCRESGCSLRFVQDESEVVLEPRNLRDIVYDDSGNLWCASDQALDFEQYAGGVWFRDASTGEWRDFKVSTPGSQMVSNRVRAVLPYRGDLWIGYSDAGIQRWNLGGDQKPGTADDGTWARYSTETTGRRIISDSITRLAARGNVLWIGSTAGISLVYLDEDRVYNVGSRLPTPDVNAILPLADGGAWVGTLEGGVTRMVPEEAGFTFTSYGPPDLPHPNVEALALDPDGRSLWIGTTRGLARLIPPYTAAGRGNKISAYPNPFVPGCGDGVRLLGYSGSADGVVVDLSGQIVRRFSRRAAGETVWDARDGAGQPVAPGLYWIRTTSPEGSRSVGVGIGDGPCPR